MAVSANTRKGGWLETATIVIEALAIAMVVRTFLYQPFNIPSGSMKETLLVGDYLFVSKLSYGYSRYSFYNFIPFEGRIFAAEPKRGDVAVFKLPRDNSTDYIKRVIGLPGDQIDVRSGVLFINGEEVPRKRIGDFVTQEDAGPPRPIPAYQGDAAQRRQVHRPRCRGERAVRQRRALQGSGRALFHDGRQPRQLHRQPRLLGRGLRAVRQPHRPRRDHFLLRRRRRAGGLPLVEPVDLAVRHPLEPFLQVGSLDVRPYCRGRRAMHVRRPQMR